MMDEQRYLHLADQTFRRLVDLFDEVDPDVADAELAGDVLTITFANGKRCIINTQRPVRQIWVAGADRAWHLSYDEQLERWLDDRGTGRELFQIVRDLARELGGIELVGAA